MNTVLVVDDDPQIRRALRVGLAATGFEVAVAGSGQEALASVALQPPEVVILDLGLPDLDGIEVLRQLREWSAIPIIVLSAREAEQEKVRALDLGADDYLTKPFGMAELLARLRVALRHGQQRPGTQPVLHFGDLEIDLPARLVTVAGREVHLTPTEYELLHALAADAGKVLTHQMLLSRVWGPASVDSTHYLRVYVNQLRAKLGPPGQPNRYIATEPGVGYRLRREPV